MRISFTRGKVFGLVGSPWWSRKVGCFISVVNFKNRLELFGIPFKAVLPSLVMGWFGSCLVMHRSLPKCSADDFRIIFSTLLTSKGDGSTGLITRPSFSDLLIYRRWFNSTKTWRDSERPSMLNCGSRAGWSSRRSEQRQCTHKDTRADGSYVKRIDWWYRVAGERRKKDEMNVFLRLQSTPSNCSTQASRLSF